MSAHVKVNEYLVHLIQMYVSNLSLLYFLKSVRIYLLYLLFRSFIRNIFYIGSKFCLKKPITRFTHQSFRFEDSSVFTNPTCA